MLSPSPRRWSNRLSYEAMLFFTSAITVLTFVAATTYTSYRMEAIDRATYQIADNAAPSITHLAAARMDLRQAQVLLTDYIDRSEAIGPDSPVAGSRAAAISEAYIQVGLEIDGFSGTSMLAESRPLATQIQGQIARMLQVTKGVIAQVQAGQIPEARETVKQELRPQMTVVVGSMMDGIQREAQDTQRLADQIRAVRVRSSRTAMVLNALGAILSAVVTVLMGVAYRRHAQVLREHAELQEQRAAERGMFASRVAHDILNPVGAVSLVLDLLGRSADEQRRRELIARGRRGLQQVKAIVDGMLDFARSGRPPDTEARTEVHEALEGLLVDLRAEAVSAGIELEVSLGPSCSLGCSPGVLMSLVSNLVRNAIKYMGDSSERRISLRAICGPSMVRIEVEDTGPGVPAEMQEAIFQPYVRMMPDGGPGIGLGLATVRQVARAHGGAAGVQSQEGRGARFWFELPRRD